MNIHNFAKAAGLGTAVLAFLSAGAAFAAVATSTVNVRTGPSTSYNAIDTLQRGEQVAIVDRDGSWCAVQKSGPDGWVSCAYLSDSVHYRDYDDNDAPRVSLSFGIGVQPHVIHRAPPPMWSYHDDRWDRPSRPSNSFSLSFGG